MISIINTITSRRFIFIAITIFLFGSMIAFYAITKRGSEEFISLSVLGKEMKFSNYYNSNDRSIKVNETLQWYIMVYNKMSSSEYISIRVKITNSTDIEAPYIFEDRYLIKRNSTYTLPFKWSIKSVERDSNYITIKNVMINDQEFSTSIKSVKDKDLRILIELFRYNMSKDSFEQVKNDKEVLNQIWFRVV